MSAVFVKTYPAPPFCDREILRYAGVKGDADEQTLALMNGLKAEIADKKSDLESGKEESVKYIRV